MQNENRRGRYYSRTSARGKRFTEVHHVKPLSTLEEATEINPKEDLVPVCSNCHRMIHRKKDDVLSVEELKGILKVNLLRG